VSSGRAHPNALGALGALVIIGASALCGAPALAAPSGPEAPTRIDVAVVQPADDDRVLVEAVARIRLELGASGLSSALVEMAGDGAPARVALVREDGVATIDLVGTLPDGSPLHRRLRVPPAEGGDDAAVLAMRTVEMLRGIRLEVPPVARARPDATPNPVPPAIEPPAASPPATGILRLTVGADILKGRVLGPSTALGPALSVAAAVTDHVSIVATVAGPFFTDLVPTGGGSAHTREELGTLGLRLDSSRTRTSTHLMVASGVHHLQAAYDDRGVPLGVPPTQFQVHTPQSVWTPVVAVGTGVGGRVWRRLGLSFEVAALFLQPAIDVVVNGRSVGSVGGPSFISNVSVWTTFP
jgi:hypothetical protein